MTEIPYILATNDESLNQILEKFLDVNFELQNVSNGLELLQSIKDRRPDLVLMELNMPVMTGSEACKTIKAMEGYYDLPIIICSSSTSEDDIEKGFEAGADAYITKPFIEYELMKAIEHYLGEN
ncbi:MAG: response regulator [Gammaproteobacteria bacterium]|nr:response regulator [Gammaproteobacteria bacterium]